MMLFSIATVTPAVDVSGIITSVTSAVTPAQVLLLVGAVYAAAIGYRFTWFGASFAYRKITAAVMNRIGRGRA